MATYMPMIAVRALGPVHPSGCPHIRKDDRPSGSNSIQRAHGAVKLIDSLMAYRSARRAPDAAWAWTWRSVWSPELTDGS
eukprot:CAMPEP_0115340810 /NCGR_PEP_ID=MMETSP0270-20121206/91342_1 /TAXON_ID=71861 /ORGANISM="Scrippsiella trochoidea, Strain CCMP3099" /LENGTH=79 /DNA_ID=CAMNT_0002762283 /DNA_START=47 /DNA_END=282 /DNA_ORIENTATION=-